MEPLNKGHIGIRSTVPCREAVLKVNLHQDMYSGTSEYIGIRSTASCREAVLISRFTLRYKISE